MKELRLSREEMDRLIAEHCMPGPGPGLVGVWYRPPYERQARLFYVPKLEVLSARLAASAASSCPTGGGCHHSPDCQDIHCPGRPSSRIDRVAPLEPTTALHWIWSVVFVIGFFALIVLLQELDGRHTERGAEHAEQCNP